MSDENLPLRFRSIWISDTHLGTAGCRAHLLLEFLRRTESDYLYLVGDIVDAWQLRRRWHWPQSHDDVIRNLFHKTRSGTRVVYVPGNHDEYARRFGALAFAGVRIETETIHVTECGRRLLVTHGDQFDGLIQHAKWLAFLGDGAHAALKLNQWLNAWLARRGLQSWSLAQFLKLHPKNGIRSISKFEKALAAEARRLGVDGVVCGHTHTPGIRLVDGILYCNDGDWVDSLTALVETGEGELHLVDRHGVRLPDQAFGPYPYPSARPVTPGFAGPRVPACAPAAGD